MNGFNICLSSDITFGIGSASKAGEIVSGLGKKALIVTCPWPDVQESMFLRIIKILHQSRVETVLFDRAVPNPTTESIDEATNIARREGVDVLLAIGGGSAIDTAKAISVGIANTGPIWDYSYGVSSPKAIDVNKMLPIVVITTTSGTGSHVTPYSVISNEKLRIKSGVVANRGMYPRAAIVDPELMLSMPEYITATTGFDVFAHAFESYISPKAYPLNELLAMESMRISTKNLVKACRCGADIDFRVQMAYADTLSGLCISLIDTSIPHVVGAAIIGKCPGLAHGQALALCYPAFIDYMQALSVKKLATVARLFDASLAYVDDSVAASKLKGIVSEWLKELRIYSSGKALGLPESVIDDSVDEIRTCPEPLILATNPSSEQVRDMLVQIWNQ